MTDELVTLTIDGKEISVPKGTLIIRAAEQLGIEIPRFCDHPMLDPVAACRQCYVQIEGQPKLATSCSTPVGPGMAVHTQYTSDVVKDGQEAVLEFLLINHPLDCPVCDRGGECPLQDQALAFGPGESRYVEAKRTYRKPLHLSDLVYLDRERCVLCQRCTRFCDQISGDRFIQLLDRGAAEQIGIAPGEDFRSPFSGNTVQICPVGALTASTYRFAARPFDAKSADTVCTHCAAGCNLRVDLRRGGVTRHLARDNEDVNDAWLCDKGRFAFSFVDAVDRLTVPALRAGGGLEASSYEEVFAGIAGWLAEGPAAFLTGGRLSDEDAHALSKFARVVAGTNDVDHRPAGAADTPVELEAATAAGVPVTYSDVERARTIVVAGLDAEQELPILHLRIRKAVRRGRARVLVIHSRRTRLHDVAEHVLCRPGEEAAVLTELARLALEAREAGEASAPAASGPLARTAAAIARDGDGVVVLAGPRLGEAPGALARAAALAEGAGGRFALLARRSNDRGALRAGLHPGLLPGGRMVDDPDRRAQVEVPWGTLLPSAPGRDTAAILRAAADREIRTLFLVGVDPLRDFPDAALARRALENVTHTVVVDIAEHGMAMYADALLPAAAYLEKDGHVTDWEGRAQRLRPVRSPAGLARSDWQIFQALSAFLGRDLGFHAIEDLREEMARLWAASEGAGSGPAPATGAPATGAPATGAPATPTPPTVVGVDDHQVVLFSYPLLVDEGRQSDGADRLKAALEEPAFVEVHPLDAERLGVVDGGTARVETKAGSALLPVRVSEHVAAGSAFVPWNQPGLAANTLFSGRPTAAATVAPAGEGSGA